MQLPDQWRRHQRRLHGKFRLQAVRRTIARRRPARPVAPIGANSPSCPLVPNSGTCLYASTSRRQLHDGCGLRKASARTPGSSATLAHRTRATSSGTCSAGKPKHDGCSTATDCNVTGACTTGTNTGTACTANGVERALRPDQQVQRRKAKYDHVYAANAIATRRALAIPASIPARRAREPVPTRPAAQSTSAVPERPGTTPAPPAPNATSPGTCTTGTNTGAACTVNGVNATCGAVNKCTVGKVGITCTTNAQCNTDGTCTTGTNTGAACTVPGANAACGPINKCSAGLPSTTSCAPTDATCNKTGACTTGANTGATCTTNGVNAACGAVNKCTRRPARPPLRARPAAACNVNGSCTTGANTGVACTANGVNRDVRRCQQMHGRHAQHDHVHDHRRRAPSTARARPGANTWTALHREWRQSDLRRGQ